MAIVERLKQESIRPFIRGKIRRILHKTRLKQDANCTIYTSMSYLIRRVLAKPHLILDEMCRLYRKFVSYLRRVLCKTRLIFPRINGPNVQCITCPQKKWPLWRGGREWRFDCTYARLGRTYMCMYVSVDVFNLQKHTLYKNHNINCILLRSNKAGNYNDFWLKMLNWKNVIISNHLQHHYGF